MHSFIQDHIMLALDKKWEKNIAVSYSQILLTKLSINFISKDKYKK